MRRGGGGRSVGSGLEGGGGDRAGVRVVGSGGRVGGVAGGGRCLLGDASPCVIISGFSTKV